jgi:quercetin dioxygenase-like cupin family protein
MRNLKIFSVFAAPVLCLLVIPVNAWGHAAPEVVPDRERQISAEGPTETRGVESVTVLGAITLSDEFPGMEGRQLRAREIVIGPGGVIAVHRHDQRPGVAYILDGEIVEHRNDADGPITRRAGDAAFEKTGVIHWWENTSEAMVRALVVDIVEELHH